MTSHRDGRAKSFVGGEIMNEQMRQRRGRLWMIVAVLTIGGMLLAACGGSKTTPAPAQSPTTDTKDATAAAIASATGNPNIPTLHDVVELAPPVPQDGGSQPGALPNATLTYQMSSDIPSADPAVDSWGNIYPLVFMPLLSLTPDNRVAQYAAENMQLSDDGMTYTFKLRKTFFSDGVAVTAGDYAFGMQRVCDPVVAGSYSNVFFDIVGCQDWRSADESSVSQDQMNELRQAVEESIKAIAEDTLQIKISHPAGYFPYVLTLWMTDPVRRDLVENDPGGWWKNPDTYLGNGPFRVTKYTPNQEWVFEPNPHFPLGKPGISKLTLKIIPSSATALLAYQTGELDIYALSTSQYPQVLSNPVLKPDLIELLSPSTMWLYLNMEDPPFDSLEVRQAFASAMNRELYIQQVNSGAGQPAGTLLYPGIPGYQTEYQQAYDPDRAKALLADAGYPGGKDFPAIKLYFDGSDDLSKKDALFWSDQFKQVLGVNIVPSGIDSVELSKMFDEKDPELQLTTSVWWQDYPSAQNWLSLLFGNDSPFASRGWNDPKFNDLVNQADRLSGDEAAALYAKADAYLAEMAAALFYMHGADLTLVKPYVRGYSTGASQTYGFYYNMVFGPGAMYVVEH